MSAITERPEATLTTSAPATPAEELTTLVLAGAAAFYWAESGANESVQTYWDALHYIATSLSVGYANIFPVTPLGKTIGALVMMVGPALSARALEPAPAPTATASGESAAVVEKLDQILAELKRLNGATGATSESQ